MAKLCDYFERIRVLNLPYKQERRERLTKHLEELGMGEGVGWVRAYSGDKITPPAWWNAGNGAWGCLLSHANLIAEALADDVESLLLMEDDVVFRTNTAEMLDVFMKQVPSDWGQIYLGGQHLADPLPVPMRPFVLKAKCVNRTHAFVIHKRAMEALHRHIWHAPDYIAHQGGWHVDHQLGIAHEREDWPVYAPAYWIAGQDEEWSNISGRYNTRHWWHPKQWATHLPFVYLPSAAGDQMEADAKSLHGGYNLKPGTFEDIALDVAAISDDRLLKWLECIATEALDIERLPALQHPAVTPERLSRLWKGGVVPWSPGCMDKVRAFHYEQMDGIVMDAMHQRPSPATERIPAGV